MGLAVLHLPRRRARQPSCDSVASDHGPDPVRLIASVPHAVHGAVLGEGEGEGGNDVTVDLFSLLGLPSR